MSLRERRRYLAIARLRSCVLLFREIDESLRHILEECKELMDLRVEIFGR